MSFYDTILEKAARRASVEFKREITVEALKEKSKMRCIVYPRYFAIAYMHAIGRFSLPQVAKAFGFSDHTTVLHALRRAHGHNGELVQTTRYKNRAWVKMEPLWKKERFENLVYLDGYTDQCVMNPSMETLLLIGERNMREALKALEPQILEAAA